MRQQDARNRRKATNTRPASLQIATQGITPPVAALQKKMARERAYLDRRAARRTYTPTDEAYEADQLLEADLLDMLDEFERHVALMES